MHTEYDTIIMKSEKQKPPLQSGCSSGTTRLPVLAELWICHVRREQHGDEAEKTTRLASNKYARCHCAADRNCQDRSCDVSAHAKVLLCDGHIVYIAVDM